MPAVLRHTGVWVLVHWRLLLAALVSAWLVNYAALSWVRAVWDPAL
jgi:hypothetical protein